MKPPRATVGDAPVIDLGAYLPHRLWALSTVLEAALEERIAAALASAGGLTLAGAEWRLVAALGRSPGLSAAEAGARTGLGKVAVSRAVAALRRRRLVAREVAATDRRRSVLVLTARGQAVHALLVPELLAYTQDLHRALPRQERDPLDRALARLASRAAALRQP